MATYSPGDTVELPVTFTVGGTLTDPADVTLIVRAPDGSRTTYEYLTDDEVTKTTTGTYLGTVTATQSGVYGVMWEGTDTAAGVYETTFVVEVSLLDRPGLCTLDDVKLARRGLPAVLDDLVVALIARASDACGQYAGRQFTIDSSTASDRWFPTPGFTRGRVVLIDDLAGVPTQADIADEYGSVLTTLDVDEDLVYLPRNRRAGEPIDAVRVRPGVTVLTGYELRLRGVWGFPAVPPAAREACIETVVEWLKGDQAITVTSPEVFEPGGYPSRGLPQKARDLLRPFRRIGVG